MARPTMARHGAPLAPTSPTAVSGRPGQVDPVAVQAGGGAIRTAWFDPRR